MPATCNYDALQAAVVTALGGLGLMLGTTLLPVTRVKAPTVDEWNPPPQLQVYPIAGGKWSRLFGRTWLIPYGVGAAFVAAGNRDTVTNLSGQLGWVAALKRLLAEPDALAAYGITCLTGVQVNEEVAFDRSGIPDGYDASPVALIFTALEDH